MKTMWRVFRRRFNERSTWLGLLGFLAAFGVSMEPDQMQAIATAGVALYGVLQVFLPDPKGKIVHDEEDEELIDLTADRVAERLQQPKPRARTPSELRRSHLDDEEYPGGFG